MTSARTETPQDAARRLAGPQIRVEALHVYRDAAGKEIYGRIRGRDGHGEKWIRPMRFNGHGYELREPDFPNGKPLYKLDRIAANPTAPVWIVEGEKAVGALTKLGAIATTSGGAQSAAAADWTPLRGRDCRLWADNDDAGKTYMGEVAAILQKLDCKLSAVDLESLQLPPKGDAADWVQEHPDATLANLEALRLAAATGAPNAEVEGAVIELVRADTITPQPIKWVWDGFLAGGKLHIVAGAPGTGKTTLALAIAATITTGGRWPDGTRAGTGDVLIWSGEDSAEDTLVPRLIAAGANRARIHIIRDVRDGGDRRPFDPAIDFPDMAVAAARIPDLRLMIVDPIVSAVAGDSHKNSETRRALQPLVDFAERSGCALLGASHFSKGTQGRDPLERVTGSLAFGAVARVVLATAKLRDDEGGGRVLVRAKSNIGPDGGGYGYDLQQIKLSAFPGVVASRTLWGKPIEGTARAILAQAEPATEEGDRSMTDEAVDLLRDILVAGRVLSNTAKQRASQAGISDKALRNARSRLGVIAEREGFGSETKTYWSIPAAPLVPSKPTHAQQNGWAQVDPEGTSGGPMSPASPFVPKGASGDADEPPIPGRVQDAQETVQASTTTGGRPDALQPDDVEQF